MQIQRRCLTTLPPSQTKIFTFKLEQIITNFRKIYELTSMEVIVGELENIPQLKIEVWEGPLRATSSNLHQVALFLNVLIKEEREHKLQESSFCTHWW